MSKEELLTEVFESIPDLFFLVTEDGTIIECHAGDSRKLYVQSIYCETQTLRCFNPKSEGGTLIRFSPRK